MTLNEIGKLGYGSMRLDEKYGTFEERVSAFKTLFDEFYKEGFNYIDTARIYGDSEDVIREAVVKRYSRDKFFITTKVNPWIDFVKTKEQTFSQFDESLSHLGVDYVDCYLIHGIKDDTYHFCEDYDLFNFISDKKKKGLTKYIGMSYHGSPELLDEILSEHPELDVIQLQINYLDWNSSDIQSKANYKVARKYNKPIIVMEPNKGGRLSLIRENCEDIFREVDPYSSPTSWSMKFVNSLPGILTILSGMKTKKELYDNIITIKYKSTSLTEEEKKALNDVCIALKQDTEYPCTKCCYCQRACPQHIGISGAMVIMNDYLQSPEYVKSRPNDITRQFKNNGGGFPEDCLKCKKCEQVCPQHIKITEVLDFIKNNFKYNKN